MAYLADVTMRLAGGLTRVAHRIRQPQLAYLRSANRLGTLPEDRSWRIGFRVVCGAAPNGKPLPAPAAPPH